MNRLFKYFRYEYIIVNIELTISIMSLLKNHNSFKNYKISCFLFEFNM